MGIASESTKAIYQYWEAKRKGRSMPSRLDIDPIEMKVWLPGIQLIDVYHHPQRLVYRLVGQADVDFRGYNPTGKSVAECAMGQTLADSLENYEIVLSTRTFVFDFAQFLSPSGLIKNQECILMPLSEDDAEINMIMTYGKVEQLV